jgi:hypothetical protein
MIWDKQGPIEVVEITETIENVEIQATLRADVQHKYKVWCSGSGCNNQPCDLILRMLPSDTYYECNCTEEECTLNMERNGFPVSTVPDSVATYIQGRNMFFEDLEDYIVDSLSSTLSSVVQVEFITLETGTYYSVYYEFFIGSSTVVHNLLFLGSGNGSLGPEKKYKCTGSCTAAECKARMSVATTPPTPYCSCEETCILIISD